MNDEEHNVVMGHIYMVVDILFVVVAFVVVVVGGGGNDNTLLVEVDSKYLDLFYEYDLHYYVYKCFFVEYLSLFLDRKTRYFCF